GEAKCRLVFDIAGDTFETTAGQGVLAGVNERDTPRLRLLLMHNNAVVGHVEGNVRHVQKVVGEVFLDHIALVPAADHEVVCPVSRIQLHDVPQDRPAADLDHRLGFEITLLGNASAKSAGEDDDLHGATLHRRRSV